MPRWRETGTGNEWTLKVADSAALMNTHPEVIYGLDCTLRALGGLLLMGAMSPMSPRGPTIDPRARPNSAVYDWWQPQPIRKVRTAEADAVTDVGAWAPGSIMQRLVALEENDSRAEKEGGIQVPCWCNFLHQISWMPHRLMAEQKKK